MSFRKKVPWQLKIAAKLALSRLPFNYGLWSKYGLFRHGEMDNFDYAWKVLNRHVKQMPPELKGWSGLELGPGDGILSALLAPALKSAGLSLLDSDDYIDKDINKYYRQVNHFLDRYNQYVLPDYSSSTTIDEILQSAGGAYYYKGLPSLRSLKDNSFDIIYSQAVLEHIKRNEFSETIRQCRRLLKPGGIMSHVIDFKDHLGGGLNNLRIPSSLWERAWFASKGNFYTNRLRYSEVIRIFEDYGFVVKVVEVNRFETIQIQKKHLAREFSDLSEDDLSISEAHLVMF